jgi:hypothetical protein
MQEVYAIVVHNTFSSLEIWAYQKIKLHETELMQVVMDGCDIVRDVRGQIYIKYVKEENSEGDIWTCIWVNFGKSELKLNKLYKTTDLLTDVWYEEAGIAATILTPILEVLGSTQAGTPDIQTQVFLVSLSPSGNLPG